MFLGIGTLIDRWRTEMWFSQDAPTCGCWGQIRPAQSRPEGVVSVRKAGCQERLEGRRVAVRVAKSEIRKGKSQV